MLTHVYAFLKSRVSTANENYFKNMGKKTMQYITTIELVEITFSYAVTCM